MGNGVLYYRLLILCSDESVKEIGSTRITNTTDIIIIYKFPYVAVSGVEMR